MTNMNPFPMPGEQTLSRLINFASNRLRGDEAWTVVGTLGSALACLTLQNYTKAAWYYSQARRNMRVCIQRHGVAPRA